MRITQSASRASDAGAHTLHYERVQGPHGEALAGMAPEHPVGLLLDLMRHVDGPLAALYILCEPSGPHAPARYQSPFPVGRRRLRAFCERFAPFLEEDGRHALWILDERSEQRLIFDRHDLVFAYGRLDAFERVLVKRGYTPGTPTGLLPDHRPVSPENDTELDRLLEWWSWLPTPLWPGDEL